MKSVEIAIRTTQRTQMIDITRDVSDFVEKSGITDGICTIFVPHTTAAVTINENADSDVVRDICMELDRIVPWQDGYAHSEGNSAAHLKSSMIGCSQQILIEDGKLLLGVWQGVFFCEFDGSRNRKVVLKAIGA